MARTRSLKPGFFSNEVLGKLPPLARLLFEGLWCYADREGRLEDRPLRLKAEILPYDECDGDELLNLLAGGDDPFILRYTVGGRRYLQVLKFAAHQKPHAKEAASTIPAPDGFVPSINRGVPDHNLGSDEEGGSNDLGDSEYALDTSSLIPLTDSSNSLRDVPLPAPPEQLNAMHAVFVGLRGYVPTDAFYRKVAEKYGHLDLEEEAIKAREWLSRHRKRECTPGFILNWLKTASEQAAVEPISPPLNGRHRPNGRASPHQVQEALYQQELEQQRKALPSGPH